MTHYHAVIWIDHHEAHVVEFGLDGQSIEVIRPRKAIKHLHARSGSASGWRAVEDPAYFDDVASALEGVGEILITGPAGAKLAFFKRLQAKHAALAAKVIGVETVDHPTDGELVNFAKKYFHKAERMLPQID
ncbi:MAG: translational machinery protein [Parvibaculum sp.]|nr:translational machinery protein [Parvibaculum sp.]